MNWPLIPTTLVIPSARPRWFAGNASVRIATELRDQERRADALHDAEADQPVGAGAAGHPVDRQEQRGERVDDEAEVVHPHPPVQVAEPAEADDEHARHDEEAEDHPEQVEAVARLQRVEMDAAEDVRHRDQHDRARRSSRGARRASCSTARPTCTFVALASSCRNHAGKLYSLPAWLARTTNPTLSVARAASELRLVLGQLIRRLRVEHNFAISHATVLGRLDREGPRTTSALAAAERVRPQSMAQTVSDLQRGRARRPPPRSARRPPDPDRADRPRPAGTARRPPPPRRLARPGDRVGADGRGAGDSGQGDSAAAQTCSS